MAEMLPVGVYDNDDARPVYIPNGIDPSSILHSNANGEHQLRADAHKNSSDLTSSVIMTECVTNGVSGQMQPNTDALGANEMTTQNERFPDSIDGEDHPDTGLPNGGGRMFASTGRSQDTDANGDHGLMSRNSTPAGNQVEAEWNEQYEPGVYITLVALRDGTRDLKRVRFRYLRKKILISFYSLGAF